jgi:hypothetical protein
MDDRAVRGEGGGSSGPTFPADQVDTRLIDLGLLMGVLQQISGTPSSGTIGVDFSWFHTGSNPPTSPLLQLAQIPERAVPLLDLLNGLLLPLGGPDPIDPPDSAWSGKRNWYPITYGGAETGFFVVIPRTAADTANVIGLGFSKQWSSGTFSAQTYGLFPIFEVPNPASRVFVLGSPSAPIEAHLDVLDGSGPQATGFRLSGSFTFSALPTFTIQMLANGTVTATYRTVKDLLADLTAVNAINVLLSLPAAQTYLNRTLGSTRATPGTILGPKPAGLGYLSSGNGVYALANLMPFEGQSSLSLARTFFRVLLDAVADATAPLVPIGAAPNGIYVVSTADASSGNDYGILVRLPPITVPLGTPGTSPSILLQLGAWLSNEGNDADGSPTWWARSGGSASEPTPGLALYLLHEDDQGELSFTGVLELASIGIDVEPPANQPLVQLGRFVLDSVEARGYLKLDFTASQVVAAQGGAMLCRGIGIPLGGSFGSAGGVASSILTAGGTSDPQSGSSVNPTFSLAASYLRPGDAPYAVQLYDAQGTPGPDVNLPLQRSFGPLHVESLGVGWQNASSAQSGALTLTLNGGVNVGPLAVEVIGLDVTVLSSQPLEPASYSVVLRGMNVSFTQDPVALDGGLTESDGQFYGQASIELSPFSIGAFGAYGTTGGAPSLFVFGWTNDPIGGPPWFYVHGIAAGFGFNRAINLPTIEGVPGFPFVAALGNPAAFGGGSRQQQASNALTQLVQKNDVPMSRGSYWLTAGIAFTSFEIVDSTALLAIEFGPDLTISILGTSTLQLPKQSGTPYVYAELALLVALKPSAGTFLAQGQLTQNSYVLDPACHLTGGFAFATWWQPPHDGEFVLTAGGYHPMFTPPSYYPVVPRLGFTWNVSDTVTIKGSSYFALTPSCVMGGGELSVLFQSGNLRAWFDAQADVLIRWKPFYFDANTRISVGVSYKINLLYVSTTLTVSLGAGLHLWGPPTGGTVYVDWYVISFSIDFGASQNSDAALEWGDFVGQMLPNRTPPALPATSGRRSAAPVEEAMPQPRIDVSVTGGKISQPESGGWLVRSDGLAFTVRTSVPHTAVAFNAPTAVPFDPDLSGYRMGIVPMQAGSVKASLTIAIAPVSGTINGTFTPALLVQAVPLAVWGTDPTIPSTPSSQSVSLPVGLTVAADPYQPTGVPVIALPTLAYDTIDPKPGVSTPRVRRVRAVATDLAPVTLPLIANAPTMPVSAVVSNNSLQTVADTIMDPARLRARIVAALDDFGFGTKLPGAPAGMAAALTANLRAPVLLGSPAGVPWPTTTPEGA